MTLIYVLGGLWVLFMIFSIWWMCEFSGLPQALKCKLGAHNVNVYEVEEKPGYGMFGGVLVIYWWTCKSCGQRGST